MGGVYFQPVDMEPEMGTPAAESSMHIEADVSAADNNDLGYGVGDFVPGLTVEYAIKDKSGTAVQEGTLMPMNASDGPHYGLNLPKLDAGTYDVSFMIKPPSVWLLHTDKTTGVEGRFWTEPLVAEFPDWQWDPTAGFLVIDAHACGAEAVVLLWDLSPRPLPREGTRIDTVATTSVNLYFGRKANASADE